MPHEEPIPPGDISDDEDDEDIDDGGAEVADEADDDSVYGNRRSQFS